MPKIRVIPCLLLKDWGIEKSIRFGDRVYVGSPINAVRVFNGRNVDELILLDITATRENRGPNTHFISQIGEEACMPLTVGGGIRTVEGISALMAAGADRVVINTAAVELPQLVTAAADRFGSQCVVVSVDAKRHANGSYEVMTHAGRQATGLDPVAWAQEAERRGAGEIFLMAIDRDGTMEGYDLDLIRRVADAVSIPVIAAGGAGRVADLAAAVDAGHASAVACGAFFLFYGKRRAVLINYPTDDELLSHLGPHRIRRKDRPLPPAAVASRQASGLESS